ncbi:MAG: GNAT family N-acetyltransferase [Chloroflexi bacterium]|nr:GNAT family N-acetyltransferase [Chloroflexota bacterium]
MYEVQHVRSDQLPLEISLQVTSFFRIVWGADEQGEARFWQMTDPEGVVEHFYIAERGLLVSHALVKRMTLTHMGESYTVLGVGGVITYPAFRREGHGARVVAAASDAIRSSDADLGMLFAGLGHHPFYQRNGWTPLKREGVYYGDPQKPEHSDSHLMILPVSDKAIAHQEDFERGSLYVGPETW